MSNPGRVYFIQDGYFGPVKIGWTAGEPRSRLSALQTGNANTLRLVTSVPGSQNAERLLHNQFAELRMTGEWFRPEPPLLGFMWGVEWSQRDEAHQ